MNSKPLECRGKHCDKKIIFLINSETNRSIPVEYDSLTTDEIKGLDSGINVLYNKVHHINHYTSCPDRDRFRKKKDS